MYTTETKQEIEQVLAVFKPFIDQADYLEIVWSNKRQCYVSLFIDTTRDCFDGADEIHSAEEICEKCYTEIGNDILLENDREYELWQMHKLERDEFYRRIQPFDAQLPEYHFLIEQLLSQPPQAE